ncbi:anthranilate phosphoribosyltransferase [Rhizorhapis suberifaciens]|uniref:Anthranilate phosphoribosyltransferase n=1 Tax=Rhizorhapis suberifaciens TaxID=13656 RepID=A0A840HXD2_9SPHN|nr:anthranilate phosphoribosyltransferase [Rhizorhapis suberifaciens]MBB4642267.1 anthranilate phosphoribosyltransferase [Rhizorhapis suberifaciens]
MTSLPDPSTFLNEEQSDQAFAAILDRTVSDSAIADFLVRLSERGETATEIAAAAQAMRARMIPITAPADAIDVCGTGGDGHHTLNISTAVAIIVAACGVPVAKHGNRAASSKAGAADTLEALGLDLNRAGETAEQSLADLGICFLFAQAHHPSLAHVAPIRRSLGRRTIFNLMGPLANPANVRRQLIGIARPDYVPVYAEALLKIGTEHSMVVSGEEGLDELSLADGNSVTEIESGELRSYIITAAHAGLPTHNVEAIKGGDAEHNAQELRKLLLGEEGPYRDAVLFNSAAALMVAGEVKSLAEGAEEAAEAIDKGLANALLNCWIAF